MKNCLTLASFLLMLFILASYISEFIAYKEILLKLFLMCMSTMPECVSV